MIVIVFVICRGGFMINDFYSYGLENIVIDVIVKLLNIGMVYIVEMIGVEW